MYSGDVGMEILCKQSHGLEYGTVPISFLASRGATRGIHKMDVVGTRLDSIDSCIILAEVPSLYKPSAFHFL